MSENKNYWKDAYKDTWGAASTKETFVKELIEAKTGLEVTEVGLGAGTTDYLSGSAKDHDLTKGDADLYIAQKGCFIEVTGPNIPLLLSDSLWIRPDKLENTRQKIKDGKGSLHMVFHILSEKTTKEKIIRIIKLDKKFFSYYDKKAFPIIHPRIRGKEETYVELPHDHEVILSLEDFFKLLK